MFPALVREDFQLHALTTPGLPTGVLENRPNYQHLPFSAP